jgi:suppressor for copper-sensitivity B
MREIFHRVAGIAAAAVLAVWAGGAGPARAIEAASPWAGPDTGKARLIASRDAAGGPPQIGVQISLAPGWKTYWRSPGDAGLPPEFDWSGSSDLGPVTILWPAPRRQDDAGLQSFVYADEVVFPIRAAPPAGGPLRLRLKLSYGVCKDICIPADAELALDLPAAGGGQALGLAQLIARYAAKAPKPAAASDVRFKPVTLVGANVLAIEAESATPFRAPDLIVEGPPVFWFGKPETVLDQGGKRVKFRVPAGGARDLSGLGQAALTLTLIDGPRAVEEQRTVGR